MNFASFNIKIFSFIALTLLVISSCNKEEPIPSYIHIDTITLTTNPSTEGSNSNKIVDAWIYIDEKLLGVFELPCTVPYLGEGTHIVSIGAGIKKNGIASTREAYPFYKFYSGTITFARGEKTTVNPTVNYFPGIIFDLNPSEDFESAGSIFCDTSGTDTSLIAASSVVFEGTRSGAVILDGSKTFYFGQTCSSYTLPKAGANVYLELNYKCNQPFVVGIISFTSAGTQLLKSSLVTINKSNAWNKIYIDLSDEVSSVLNVSAEKFRFFFSMAKESGLSASELYLDNIKLIH